jgi:2-polyprenyl-3-methyl-5-hydroxy-6-metoxy-1,4-benzoquinol methylase
MHSCFQCQNNPQSEFKREIHGYQIRECTRCGHQFAEATIQEQAHLEEVFGDEYFEGGGEGYPGYLQEGKLLIERGKKYAEILKRHMPQGTVLDIGSAAGFILKGLVESGWDGTGVEPNARMSQYGREHLGLNMITAPAEAIEATGQQFDLVSIIQVITSFYDMNHALETLAKLTKPQGYWLIETWNRKSLTARVAGSRWHEYCPPSVLHWVSPESLRFLARQYGFEFVAMGYLPKKISLAHGKSLLGKKLTGMRGERFIKALMGLAPDRMTVVYPFRDLFWMILRKVEVVDFDKLRNPGPAQTQKA